MCWLARFWPRRSAAPSAKYGARSAPTFWQGRGGAGGARLAAPRLGRGPTWPRVGQEAAKCALPSPKIEPFLGGGDACRGIKFHAEKRAVLAQGACSTELSVHLLNRSGSASVRLPLRSPIRGAGRASHTVYLINKAVTININNHKIPSINNVLSRLVRHQAGRVDWHAVSTAKRRRDGRRALLGGTQVGRHADGI